MLTTLFAVVSSSRGRDASEKRKRRPGAVVDLEEKITNRLVRGETGMLSHDKSRASQSAVVGSKVFSSRAAVNETRRVRSFFTLLLQTVLSAHLRTTVVSSMFDAQLHAVSTCVYVGHVFSRLNSARFIYSKRVVKHTLDCKND